MAEVFGVVSGAVGVAAVFNNCVTCFEYIQLARHFGDDFGRCQLKLDASRNRLVRWGQLVDIGNNRALRQGSDDPKGREAGEILDGILGHMKSAYVKTKRYEGKLNSEERAVLGLDDMTLAFRRVHDRFSVRAQRYQTTASLTGKIAWALYDKKRLEDMLLDIKELIEELEELGLEPVKDTRSNLIKVEVEEIDEKESLLALQDAAADADEMLSKAAEEKVKELDGNNTVKGSIKTGHDGKVLVGSSFSDAYRDVAANINDKYKNSVGSVDVGDSSSV